MLEKIQWTGDNEKEVHEFLGAKPHRIHGGVVSMESGNLFDVHIGDWIVRTGNDYALLRLTESGETKAAPVIVQFGRGNIIISKARNPEKSYQDEICLIVDDRDNPVNETLDETLDAERWAEDFAGKSSDEISCVVRLAFKNVAGLDALLAELTELRTEMVAVESSVNILSA